MRSKYVLFSMKKKEFRVWFLVIIIGLVFFQRKENAQRSFVKRIVVIITLLFAY